MADQLTISQLERLAELLDTVRGNKRITREVDGAVLTGTARAFTTKEGYFLGPTRDVREEYVWVSATFEHFWPVAEVLAGMTEGTVACDYDPEGVR